MNYHFFSADLAYDAEFKESDHPRKDNGQFGQGSGGNGSSTPSNGIQKSAQVSSTLTGVFTQAGFKKQKQPGANGTVVYFHPGSGAKVSVHPAPEGKKWSSKWTHEANGESKTGEGSSLAKLLNVAVKKAEAKQAEAGSGITPGQKITYEHALSGYKITANKPDLSELIYTHPNGAKVLLDTKTSAWVAQSPGHMTKEGQGGEALNALLNEKKIAPGVKNTNKTAALTVVETDAQKAAKAKVMAEQAANQAKHAETAAKKQAEYQAGLKTYEAFKKAAPDYTAAEKNAIGSYSGNAYTQINAQLRNPESTAGVFDAKVQAIDAFLKKSSFPEDAILFRGIKGSFADHLKSVMAKGTKFVDYGFISTSALENSAFGGALRMKITVKKGQRGAAIYDASHHKQEYEVLLPRESMFEVTHYDRKNGYIEVNLVQDHLE